MVYLANKEWFGFSLTDMDDWMDIKQVFRRIWRCVQVWRAMFKQSMVREVDRWCSYLEALIATPLAIMPSWRRSSMESSIGAGWGTEALVCWASMDVALFFSLWTTLLLFGDSRSVWGWTCCRQDSGFPLCFLCKTWSEHVSCCFISMEWGRAFLPVCLKRKW